VCMCACMCVYMCVYMCVCEKDEERERERKKEREREREDVYQPHQIRQYTLSPIVWIPDCLSLDLTYTDK